MLPRSLLLALAALPLIATPAAAQIPLPIPTVVPTVVPGVPSQGPGAQAYQSNDGKGFRDILPPGTRGRYNAAELAAFLATKQTVPHCCDQLGMYRDLMYATPGLQASQEPREPAPVCGRRFWESRGATARTSPVEPAVGRLPR